LRRLVFVRRAALATVIFLAAACAGEPPSISNLTLSPDVVPAGTSTQVSGSVDFSDPDGDVEELVFSLAMNGETPGEASQEVPTAAGLEQGTVAFILLLQPPETGTVDIGVWLVDADGSESNHLSTSVTAE